jgi:prepilin-type N-terminal cleavage/methylation domain-containing protein
MMGNRHAKRGFTLIELLIVLSVGGVVLTVLGVLLTALLRQSRYVQESGDRVADLARLERQFNKDVRAATGLSENADDDLLRLVDSEGRTIRYTQTKQEILRTELQTNRVGSREAFRILGSAKLQVDRLDASLVSMTLADDEGDRPQIPAKQTIIAPLGADHRFRGAAERKGEP